MTSKKATAAEAAADAADFAETMFKEPKLDLALMNAAIGQIDEILEAEGQRPVNGSLPLLRKAELLDSFYLRTVAKDDLIECHVCGGHSSGQMKACPFCGNEEDPPTAESAPPRRSTRPVAVARRSVPPARKSVPAPAARRSVAPQAPKVAKSKAMAVRLIDQSNELNASTAAILELKNDIAKNYWQIGRELGRVLAADLWKQRLGQGGVPLYKSFDQYTKAELGFAKPTAYAMIDVSTQYSEKLIAKVGVSKLALVLSAPGDVRDELLDEVERGAPLRQIRERVKKERAKKSKKQLAADRAEVTGRTARGSAGGRPSKRLTVAAVEGKVTLEMYAKPKVKMAPGELPEKRAKRLGDQPFAMETMSNGVVRYYTVLAKPAGWKLQIDTVRP